MEVSYCLLGIAYMLMLKAPGTLAGSCGVAEEGKSFDLSHHVMTENPGSVSWNVIIGDTMTYLGQCQVGSTPPCFTNPIKTGYQMNTSSGVYNLTILNVNRADEMTYYLNVDTNLIFTCNLTVYAKPQAPTCQPPSLTSATSSAQLSVTCSTSKVYPQAQCAFKLQGNQTELQNVKNTSSQLPGTGPTYYTSTCTLTYTVHSPGIYAFVVDMFVVIGGTQYGKQSNTSGSITLTLPRGDLATNCPSGVAVVDGYIKQGTTATCRCERVDAGLPVGQVQWYNSGGQPVVSTVDSGDGSATITVSTTDTVQNFTCRGKSVLGVQDVGVPFIPKFAYGPTQVTISRGDSTSTTIDLCPNTNRDVTIQCQVPRNDVNPQPNFTVSFNGTDVPGVNPGSDVYQYRVTNTLDTAGTLSATCRAVNSLFSEITKENSLQILVQKPPSSPPQLIINSNQPVVENVPFPVSCSVDGGFPLVSGINVTCRTDHNMTSVTSDTNVISQSMMTVSRDMDGAQCECVAQHVTGCYSSQARVNLAVTYQAAVKTFTANQNQTLTVNHQDRVNLTCVADGKPPPTITIGTKRTANLTTGEGHNLTYVKDSLACSDTALYVCQVTNFVTTDKTSDLQVQVFVRCPQERRHEDNTTFSASVGDSVTLDLDVIGYPAPTSYILEQKRRVVAQVNTTDGNGESESGTYQFKYLSDEPPLGTVQLIIGKLSQDHFTDYVLTIDNGVGQALEYSFVLETASPGSEDIVPIIVGVIGGVLLLVVIVAVIFLLKRRGVFDRAPSSKLDDNEEEHVIPNDLYSGGANSGEVVVDNSDLYSGNWNRRSNEVVIDNSDLYSGFSKQGTNEVVVDNSALYGKSDDFKETREALYKNYTDVTPSMTSATAVPVNMKASNGAKQGGNSSYEDVEVGAKSSGPSVQPKPKVAVKPMTASKPTPAPKPSGPSTSGPQGAYALQDDGGDQTYASVIKTGKPQAPKTQPASQRESDYFPDQSKKPEVPEKRYEQEESLTGQEGKKKGQKKSADEIPMVPHDAASASASHDNPYVNGGFTEDDGNVYANAEGNKSRKD